MNKERILALADLIEGQEHTNDWYVGEVHGFNMNKLVYDCGTPSCIAGWAAWEALDQPKVLKTKVFGDSDYIEKTAAEYLGLEYNSCNADKGCYRLFYPNTPVYSDITPIMAATVLRHLAETGEIDWSIVGVKEPEEDDE